MVDFRNVRFLKSARNAQGAPKMRAPQVAILGRSNVGKSSLLNDLFQKRNMVKTSSLPGKTQLINFFLVDEQLLFIDLPGYGYAKVSQKMQQEWGERLEHYLNTAPLDLVLFLLDIRRTPSAQDLEMGAWLKARNVAVIVVLTKVDKVSKNVRLTNTKKILALFGWESVHYSTTKREGRQKLLTKIRHALTEKDTLHLP